MSAGKLKSGDIKIILVFLLFTAGIFILILRVFGIMFVQSATYKKDAYLQKTYESTIEAKRGNIYDRNGEELSISLTVSVFFLDPLLIEEVYGGYEEGNDVDFLFDFLAEELDLDKEDLISQLEYENHYRVIADSVSNIEADRIIEYKDEMGFKGLFREKRTERYYPNDSLASHVVGYVNQSQDGVLGIELYYNGMLTGSEGVTITEIDGLGREIPFADSIEIAPVDGDRIYLTIDKTIQKYVQDALADAIDEFGVKNGGCIIVMEPETGKILAMASYPDFDLNGPYKASEDYSVDVSDLSGEDIEYLLQYVWRNKAVSDTYEPGSTFKVITAAAALEEDIVGPEDIIEASPVTIDGWEIKHWMEAPSAYESFEEAMYMSSNPVFVRVAQMLGINLFYEYLDKFGFMEVTGITLPAEAGSIFKDVPAELDLAVNSFGQRFQITPLQLITAYCAVANGGYLVKPYIVESIIDDGGRVVFQSEKNIVRQVISTDTSDILKGMLEGTVTDGTGKNAYVKGYRVAGKTGTSETLQTEQGRYIASFAGFAPVDSPRIAVLVMLDFPTTEHHGGGYVAAPIAGELIERILIYLKVERGYTDLDLQIIEKEKVIPGLTGLDLSDAEALLYEKDIDFQVIGSTGGDIIRQVPGAGETVSDNPLVVLYTDEDTHAVIRMPDLIGFTLEEAMNKLRSLDLNIVYSGFGQAVSQSIVKGQMVEPGTIIYVTFREMEFANGD